MDGISTTLGCLSRSSIAWDLLSRSLPSRLIVSHLIDRSLFTPLVTAGAFKGRWSFYCSAHSTVDGGRGISIAVAIHSFDPALQMYKVELRR